MELLVVILIISILIALLLPALAAARAQAESAVCLSNLRQCAMGLDEYATDWNGFILEESSAYWYSGNIDDWNMFLCRGYDMNQDSNAEVYLSPAVSVCPAAPYGTYDPVGKPGMGASCYAMLQPNDWPQGKLFTTNGTYTHPDGIPFTATVERLTNVPDPAGTIMLEDSMDAPANGFGMIGEFQPDNGATYFNQGAIRFLHGMSLDDSWANVAFYDGHAASFTPGQLINQQPFAGPWPAGWNITNYFYDFAGDYISYTRNTKVWSIINPPPPSP